MALGSWMKRTLVVSVDEQKAGKTGSTELALVILATWGFSAAGIFATSAFTEYTVQQGTRDLLLSTFIAILAFVAAAYNVKMVWGGGRFGGGG